MDKVYGPGDTLGDYRLIRTLGKGGSAAIFEARNPTANESVALKVLHPRLARDAHLRRRFFAEACIGFRLSAAPCFVEVYGVVLDPPAISMKLLRGNDLRQLLRRGPLPAGDALRLGIELLKALEVAHRNGVVHCDVNPSNVFVEREHAEDDDSAIEGRLRLIDFGIAWAIETADLIESESRCGTLP